ncbi:uncharacterized protein CDV56_103881 [Aspergillus thermomutatus]|uniref:Uncharacterized protein n=1 Tax=Aspergillus thermomutatus TaxID=41047 RepID=A0A397HCI9_ASPTH|nr:uncharacterized protein CDV56_103881 [Aspergillus thermomutatus]RHZ60687.1 hypothetical protein CDV56_103881 [Aspergillus thermomutatus]
MHHPRPLPLGRARAIRHLSLPVQLQDAGANPCRSKHQEVLYFALEPVDKDEYGKWLTLKVWWLKRHEHAGGVDFSVTPQLPSDLHPRVYEVGLHNVRDDKPLLSGDLIKLETHDPENYPLPDMRILEMQWILNRVLALRGGAEPRDLEDDESDGDLDEGLDYFPRPVV